MKVLIRADGSPHLGLGHITRCLAFAQGLEKIGASSVFVIRDYDYKIRELIQRYGYDVETMPKDCSFREDASLTSKLANQHEAKLIITDLSNVDTLASLSEYGEYLQGLKDTGKLLITITSGCLLTKTGHYSDRNTPPLPKKPLCLLGISSLMWINS